MKHHNNDFKQINLELRNSRIVLSVSTDENFHLTSKREHEYSFTEVEQTIVLNQAKWKWYHYVVPILSWRLPTKTELKLPKNFNGKILLSNRDGWACLNDIECEELSVKSRNGKILANKINANLITLSANNGKIELQNIKTNNLKGYTKNGKTKLDDIDADVLEWNSNNGKIIANKLTTEMVDLSANNGKIICDASTAERMKFETKNGKVMGNNIDTATIEADTKNGKIVFESLNAYSIKFQASNGKIIASLCGEEKDYSFDIKCHNGKSVIAGKKNHGSYIMKDKDKKKQITACTKNGSAFFVFLNNATE